MTQSSLLYFVARNKNRRPTLQHAIDPSRPWISLCGQPLEGWSRSYMPRTSSVLCINCQRRGA